ncbi:MAG TPA: hypothetical protein VK425_09680 [Acidimicrobiales bacterium]|nr:hypothetical protein [Acidimicrobiales bacterium]
MPNPVAETVAAVLLVATLVCATPAPARWRITRAASGASSHLPVEPLVRTRTSY